MKARLVAAALFVHAVCLPVVQAQNRVTEEYENFTLDYLTRNSPTALPDLQLIEDSGGETRFSLPYIAGLTFGSDSVSYLEYELDMRFLAQPGYQIVGYELSGSVTGMIWTEQPPDSPDVERIVAPDAQNSVSVHGLGFHRISNFNDTREFSFTATSGATTGYDFVDLFIYANAVRQLGFYWIDGESYRLEAITRVEFHDVQFTVYTAPIPVPEPNAWMMLVVGLMPMGWVSRRGKQGTVPMGQSPDKISA